MRLLFASLRERKISARGWLVNSPCACRTCTDGCGLAVSRKGRSVARGYMKGVPDAKGIWSWAGQADISAHRHPHVSCRAHGKFRQVCSFEPEGKFLSSVLRASCQLAVRWIHPFGARFGKSREVGNILVMHRCSFFRTKISGRSPAKEVRRRFAKMRLSSMPFTGLAHGVFATYLRANLFQEGWLSGRKRRS